MLLCTTPGINGSEDLHQVTKPINNRFMRTLGYSLTSIVLGANPKAPLIASYPNLTITQIQALAKDSGFRPPTEGTHAGLVTMHMASREAHWEEWQKLQKSRIAARAEEHELRIVEKPGPGTLAMVVYKGKLLKLKLK